ncbi:MAG: tRNA (N6-threonylcarbamoyladenosine(37)-N6)-methyltransferase TrmO [Bacteroidales bacterium]|nr:tRNA (N6-threonylcarbamoyladenosine(37)-N6)-methyltransferase TrmO [Bacteroidales bacterium]
MEISPIARIYTDFPEKFGIPRQSGLAPALRGRIVFESSYRNIDSLRGLEDFSHIWLIWEFSANVRRGSTDDQMDHMNHMKWQPTVRPPRLGGNAHIGVFATRSPFRPNPLGLSCVELIKIESDTPDGPVIHVKGADLMDGTPIYDIKPYVAYADSHPDAHCGFIDNLSEKRLEVLYEPRAATAVSNTELMESLTEVLSLDPRPAYQNDPHRVYGLSFAGMNVHFHVMGNTLTVTDIQTNL